MEEEIKFIWYELEILVATDPTEQGIDDENVSGIRAQMRTHQVVPEQFQMGIKLQ